MSLGKHGELYFILVSTCFSPLAILASVWKKMVSHTALCDQVCQWLAGQWFSLVSSTNKTYRHDLTEILLKVTLNTIKPKLKYPTSLSNGKVFYNACQNIYSCKNLHLLPFYLICGLFFYQSRNWLLPRPSYQLSKQRQK